MVSPWTRFDDLEEKFRSRDGSARRERQAVAPPLASGVGRGWRHLTRPWEGSQVSAGSSQRETESEVGETESEVGDRTGLWPSPDGWWLFLWAHFPKRKMDSGTRPVGSGCSSPAGLSREYKLVMLGAGGVGKSAMTMQFISHRFPEDHDPTIEDAYKIRIRIDDEPANLDILDTAGQAEFTAMRDQYMRAGEGFIICYSITDRRSFHEVREFKQLIYRVRRTDDTPVVLVGNKSDLKQLRQVTKEEGLALAREFSCPFFETSAAYRYYIDDVFHALVREIRRKEKEAVLAMEKKSKPKRSVWKRLKSPFRKKKDSVT